MKLSGKKIISAKLNTLVSTFQGSKVGGVTSSAVERTYGSAHKKNCQTLQPKAKKDFCIEKAAIDLKKKRSS